MTLCIYCQQDFDSTKGEGDHVIPVQLGQFTGDERFRGICSACNNDIGKSEEQFLRCSPVAIYRRIVNPTIPNHRKRRNNFKAGASGSPPPKYTMELDGLQALVEISPDNPDNMIPIDQLIIHDKAGSTHYIKLHPKMRPEQLKQKIAQFEVESIEVNYDDSRSQTYSELITKAVPHSNFGNTTTIEAGEHSVTGKIKCVFTEHYYRAIAKIAFHYFLTHTQRNFKGNEDCFKPIRKFIMGEGNKDQYFDQVRNPFRIPLGEMTDGRLLTSMLWHHVLAVDETAAEIVAYVQLFIGPKGVRPPDVIRIAKLNSPILVPSYVRGHVYTYFEDQTGNWAGSVEKLSISRLT